MFLAKYEKYGTLSIDEQPLIAVPESYKDMFPNSWKASSFRLKSAVAHLSSICWNGSSDDLIQVDQLIRYPALVHYPATDVLIL